MINSQSSFHWLISIIWLNWSFPETISIASTTLLSYFSSYWLLRFSLLWWFFLNVLISYSPGTVFRPHLFSIYTHCLHSLIQFHSSKYELYKLCVINIIIFISKIYQISIIILVIKSQRNVISFTIEELDYVDWVICLHFTGEKTETKDNVSNSGMVKEW